MPARKPQTLDEALEELALVTQLARRIHRDLCHALDDMRDVHPLWVRMKERCDYFALALGDTSEYRHALHETIDRLTDEIELLRKENLYLKHRR